MIRVFYHERYHNGTAERTVRVGTTDFSWRVGDMNRTGRQRIDGYMRQMVIHAGRMVIAFGPDIGENLLRIRNRHRVVGAVLLIICTTALAESGLRPLRK